MSHNRPVKEIPGITPVHTAILYSVRIRSTVMLLKRAAKFQDREQLSKSCGLTQQYLLDYANAADFMRLQNVGPRHVNLLRAGGCFTVRELMHLNPENLHSRMFHSNMSMSLFPPLAWVRNWINEARIINKLITYR